jgi:hypothetical protein
LSIYAYIGICQAEEKTERRGDRSALWGVSYQMEEPTAARWGASSRTTGTTKAWLAG